MSKSPRFSFKGWNFKKWLKGNSRILKEIFKIGIPLLVVSLSEWQPWAKALAVVVGKLVLDTVHFYLSEIELEE